jgi:hypothetical protein
MFNVQCSFAMFNVHLHDPSIDRSIPPHSFICIFKFGFIHLHFQDCIHSFICIFKIAFTVHFHCPLSLSTFTVHFHFQVHHVSLIVWSISNHIYLSMYLSFHLFVCIPSFKVTYPCFYIGPSYPCFNIGPSYRCVSL